MRGSRLRIILMALATVSFMGGASSAQAQQAPFKLVLTWAQGGLTVVDYPNAARCRAAQMAVEAEADRRRAEVAENAARRQRETGEITIGSPWVVNAFCIPG